LSELLRAAADAPGSSYAKLAARAVDPETGEQLTRHYLNDITRGRQVTAPPPAKLRAIASCLGEDPDTIKRLAAAQWLDYHVHTETREGGWRLWTSVRELSEEDQETVRLLAERLVRSRRGEDQASSE
jgi:hypothetical protein